MKVSNNNKSVNLNEKVITVFLPVPEWHKDYPLTKIEIKNSAELKELCKALEMAELVNKL